MELIFEIQMNEESARFMSTLPRTKDIVIVPKDADEVSYYVSETDEHPAQLITKEEFKKRGYHKHNCGGWVTFVP